MLTMVTKLQLIPLQLILKQLLGSFEIFVARLILNYLDLRIQSLPVKTVNVMETSFFCPPNARNLVPTNLKTVFAPLSLRINLRALTVVPTAVQSIGNV